MDAAEQLVFESDICVGVIKPVAKDDFDEFMARMWALEDPRTAA